MGRPDRLVRARRCRGRAHGAADVASLWPGRPCAGTALPTSAAYASPRVLVFGHAIALGMSLGMGCADPTHDKPPLDFGVFVGRESFVDAHARMS